MTSYPFLGFSRSETSVCPFRLRGPGRRILFGNKIRKYLFKRVECLIKSSMFIAGIARDQGQSAP